MAVSHLWGLESRNLDAQVTGQITHQIGCEGWMLDLNIGLVAVVRGSDACPITLALGQSKPAARKVSFELYGLTSKHSERLFSAVMEWRKMEVIQNGIFRSCCDSKEVFSPPGKVPLFTF